LSSAMLRQAFIRFTIWLSNAATNAAFEDATNERSGKVWGSGASWGKKKERCDGRFSWSSIWSPVLFFLSPFFFFLLPVGCGRQGVNMPRMTMPQQLQQRQHQQQQQQQHQQLATGNWQLATCNWQPVPIRFSIAVDFYVRMHALGYAIYIYIYIYTYISPADRPDWWFYGGVEERPYCHVVNFHCWQIEKASASISHIDFAIA